MNTASFVAGLHCDRETVAFIGNEDGKILGMGKSGSSNYGSIGNAAAASAIRTAVKQAKREAGIRGRVQIIVAAFPAIDSVRERRTAEDFVKSLRLADTIVVVCGSVATLYAATAGKAGVVVVAGIDCVTAIGLNSKGECIRVGGWGYPIDDEGSAFGIGRKSLNMAFRSFDGRERRTKLVGILKRRFGVKSFDDIVNQVYTKGVTNEQIAELMPLVSKIASSDEISRRILNGAGVKLGELACVVAQRLKMTHEHFLVTITGADSTSDRNVMRSFKATITQRCSNAHIIRSRVEVARGSLYIALRQLPSKRIAKVQRNQPKQFSRLSTL